MSKPVGTLKKMKGWGKNRKALDVLGKEFNRVADIVLNRIGMYYEAQTKKGIISQSPGGKRFEDLSERTLEARKRRGTFSTKALIDHGDLMNNVTYKVHRKKVFIGILRTAHNQEGMPLVNIGAVHEFGSKRANIPARPYMRPIRDSKSYRERAKRNAKIMFERGMKRKMGIR